MKSIRLVIVNLSLHDISGGYAEYLEQILGRAERDEQIEKILFVSVPIVGNRYEKFTKVILLPIHRLDILLGAKKSIRKSIFSFKPDIIFHPVEKCFIDSPHIPIVTLLQNMEPFVPSVPGNSLIWKLILRFLRKQAVKALTRSDHIIALSDFVKDTLVSQVGIPVTKITRISHGFDAEFVSYQKKPAFIEDTKPYLFTAGTISPARGLDDLIYAFIRLKQTGKLKGYRLCIAGVIHEYNRSWANKLKQEIARTGLEHEVQWLGFLEKEKMSWCFSHTRLFVMTSRVESFGIIAVESMSCGAPVISSRSRCLPETFGDYAEYYDPGNWLQLADKIDLSINKRNPAGNIQKRYKGSTWDDIYEETISLFHHLISTPSSNSGI